ncbi:Di-sulfide bridge nucleocytoplasmic transport domain-containing protein [Nemania sp. FL0031]|nr:Di-sulfide bridge nucleocytoplasmic transport domain-containing protein [Nemania sp. FL0031]
MMPQHPSSFFHNSRAQSTATAPPFRNAAFTTPRKPFNIDAISADQSPAELSPAVTDASDFPETPDPDQSNASLDIDHMTITSAMMNGRRPPSPKKASGKGDICKTLFPTRDKVRKRRRHNGDKDISGYRLPYIYAGEGDDSDYESDDSTSEPKRPISPKKSKRGGWFGGFLSSLHQHPYLPSILGYWLNFCFSFFCVGGTLWILWAIVAGLREDFAAAQSLVREELLDEMAKCRSDYINNKCTPVSERLPAMFQLCEQWFTCMNRNPDHLKKVQLGAKSIVEVLNEIVDTMSYKTISLLLLLFAIFVFSGRSLYKTASDFPDFTRYGPTPPPSAYGQPAANEHALPPQVYWQAIQPQTPHYNMRRLQANDETPETDTSPPRARAFKALLPPETPGGRKSPSKAERARSRSPTKPRSPAKMY